MPEELLTTAEVAQVLGCNRSTVTRRVEAGTLRAVRKLPGRTGSHLFTREEVDRARGASSEHPAQTVPV